MQPLTTSSLPPLRRRIDPSSTETAPKETGPAVVSANSIISGEMPIVRVSSPISQTPSAHPETIESQIVAYLCLPKIQFSLSRLNLNDGSYSLRMSCSRSSPRCSTRFGKVSGGGSPTVGSLSVGQRPALLVARSRWELRREI
jgi:hypothetical protein